MTCNNPTTNVFKFQYLSIIFFILLISACGGGEPSASSNTPADTQPPTYTITPNSGATIGTSQQIVVMFSESMDITTLRLSGGFVAESNGAVWSTTQMENDTLVLTPAIVWTIGSKSLTVDASDLAKNAASTLNSQFTVVGSTPSVTVSPVSSSILRSNQPVVISFDRSMDSSSLTLSGSMLAESDGGIWSSSSQPNDTLTITPSTIWVTNDGTLSVISADGNLLIDVDDLAGASISPLNLSYTKNTIYVANGGSNNAGTSSQPKASIQAAIAEAALLQVTNVRVRQGLYVEAISLVDGVNVWGGFDDNWNQTFNTNVIIKSPGSLLSGQYQTLLAKDINSSTTLQYLQIDGPNITNFTTGPLSSYVMTVHDSTGLNLKVMAINAGNAAIGSNGSNGISASSNNASRGQNGRAGVEKSVSCDDSSFGAGGAGGFGAGSGGKGGDGGTMDRDCSGGNPITDPLTFHYSATMGKSGAKGNGVSGLGGSAGAVCVSGGKGSDAVVVIHGPGGNSNANDGLISAGYWVPTGDGDSGSSGNDGLGGDGGGGSGGCDSGIDSWGSGGGGGGAGGKSATAPGQGGKAGGSSFGILLDNATIIMDTVNIKLGTGGNGGNAGRGAKGQPGGAGGWGGAAAATDTGKGGDGGKGSAGGDSGAGAGGAGGHAYGIYQANGGVYTGTVSFVNSGTGGAAGLAGSSYSISSTPAQNGTAGSAVTIY